MLKRSVLLISLIIMCSSAYAASSEQQGIYSSARWLGRGGAMVADVDDYNVMFVNPAGLPLITENILSFEFQMEGSTGVTDNLTAFFGRDKNWYIKTPSDLDALKGKDVRAKVGFLATYMTKHFAFAVISQGTLDTAYTNETVPNTDAFSSADVTLQFTYAHEFMDDHLRFGGTGKLTHRNGRFGTFTMAELQAQGLKPGGELAQEGIAFALDLGMQYTWNMQTYDLSLGGSLLDLASPFAWDPKIVNKQDNGRPSTLPARADVGVGVKFRNIGAGITWRNNLDIIKSLAHNESNIIDIIHIGTELQFPRLIFIRAGLYQAYWTAGLGIKYYILECDFATYAADTAIYDSVDGRRVSDRRYNFQFSFNF